MTFIFKNRLNLKITTLFLVCIKNLYVNSKKHDIIVSKLKLKNSSMLQMNFVKVKYIESFPIQEILILKIKFTKNYIIVLIESPFCSLKMHFTFKIPNFHMDFLTNAMFTNISKMVYRNFNKSLKECT
jgi:hypothetical protein